MGESFFHLPLKPNQISERTTAMISERIALIIPDRHMIQKTSSDIPNHWGSQ